MYVATEFQFQFGIGQVSLNINVILANIETYKTNPEHAAAD